MESKKKKFFKSRVLSYEIDFVWWNEMCKKKGNTHTYKHTQARTLAPIKQ